MTAPEQQILKEIFTKAIKGGYKYPEGLPKDQPDNLRLHIIRSLVLSPQFLKAFFGTGELNSKKDMWIFKQTPKGKDMTHYYEAWRFHGHKMLAMSSTLLQYPAAWLPKDENLKT